MSETKVTPAHLELPGLIGSCWTHLKTGGIYQVVSVARIEKDLVPCIIYARWRDPLAELWVRPASEFLDGRFVRLPASRHPA